MTEPRDHDILIPYLREALTLESSGALTWRERPLAHFLNRRAQNAWNARYAWTAAGRITKTGYPQIGLTINGRKRMVLVHRVAFALAHDRWPVDQVDHMYGVEAGNGPVNLREATNAENGQNRTRVNRNNTSGYPGVCFEKKRGRWRAQIRVGGRSIIVGRFRSKEDANAAYLGAKAIHHPFQSVPRA